VEKARPWKPWKTTTRFPTAPTVPWKSRNNDGIPTFHRRDDGSLNEKQNQETPFGKPKGNGKTNRMNRTDHV
jgi:hypothetical protein